MRHHEVILLVVGEHLRLGEHILGLPSARSEDRLVGAGYNATISHLCSLFEVCDIPDAHGRDLDGFLHRLWRVRCVPLHMVPQLVDFFEQHRVPFVGRRHRAVLLDRTNDFVAYTRKNEIDCNDALMFRQSDTWHGVFPCYRRSKSLILATRCLLSWSFGCCARCAMIPASCRVSLFWSEPFAHVLVTLPLCFRFTVDVEAGSDCFVSVGNIRCELQS